MIIFKERECGGWDWIALVETRVMFWYDVMKRNRISLNRVKYHSIQSDL